MGKGKENQGNQNIAVYVRCRPLNAQEKKAASCSVVEMNCERREVKVERLQKTFTFDRVFDCSSSQVDLYKVVVSPLLEEVLTGYSCTVFAYGQTGTGKTFTMEGERSCNREISWEEDPLSGIVPRAMHHLFETLREQALDYSLRVSFLELYNEELFDLLGPLDDASKIRLYEDPIRKGSVIVNGIEEVAVHSRDEVYSILERGTQKRQTATTLMNANSSRSHTVFSITVHIKENNVEGEELMKTGKLNLVDLAGSENIGRSGAVDKRAREAGNINQSLLTLGRVITALVERSPHIPYRESKLTRLLQDSLGGKTKTSIIATISPASINLEETLSTLDYAHRAKNIMNKPETNQKLTKKTLLKQYTEEIERLRRDLTAAREKNGIFLDPEVYHKMTDKDKNQSETIEELEQRLKALSEEFERVNDIFSKTKNDLQERDVQLAETQTTLQSTRNILENTVVVLNKTAQDRDERNVILEARIKTEKSLTDQATQLIDVADNANSDISQLHDKIHRKQTVENYNRELLENYQLEMQKMMERQSQQLKQSYEDQLNFLKSLSSSFDQQLDNRASELNSTKQLISSHASGMLNIISLLDSLLTDQAKENIKLTESATQANKNWTNELALSLLKFQHEQFISNLFDINKKECDSIRNAKVEITKKVEQFQSAGLSQVKDQLTQLENSKRKFEETYQLQENEFNYTQSQIEHFESSDDEHESELQNKISMIKSTQDEMEALLSTHKLMIANLESCCGHNKRDRQSKLNLVTRGVKNIYMHSTSIKSQFDNCIKEQEQTCIVLEKEISTSTKNIIDFTEESLDKCTAYNTEALSTMKDLEQEEQKSKTFLKEKLGNNVQMVENESKHHLEVFQTALEEQLKKTQILSEVTKAQENSQFELFETQNTQFRAFSTNQKEIIHKEVEEKHKNKEVEKQSINEISETLKIYGKNFQSDVPSGITPNRRQYIYPKTLAATSPHERIIGRFRNQMNLNLNVDLRSDDDSFDETASVNSNVGSLNSSTTSSTSSLASSTSGLRLSDKESAKENIIMRENFGFKKPEAEKKATIPKLIKKPLRPKNVDPS